MCLTEDVINTTIGWQQLVKGFRFAFVCQLQLVLQVIETVIDWCGREHEYLRLHSRADDFVHQTEIAILFGILAVLVCAHLTAITEIMALINDYKVIVAPIYTFQIEVVTAAMFTREVCVIENVVIQTVFRQRIVNVVLAISIPVLKQFFGAKH